MSPFRHMKHAFPGNFIRRQLADIFSCQFNFPLFCDMTRDRIEKRGLPSTVASNQGNYFMFPYLQADSMKGFYSPVISNQILNFQHCLHLPDMPLSLPRSSESPLGFPWQSGIRN